MNILILLAHSIEEYDQLRILSGLGHRVFSIGAYTDPAHPADDKRPALPEVPYYSDLAALVEGDQMAHKAHLPDDLIDWADTIIAHHFVSDWLIGQWARIRHKRVIWRTVGQTTPQLEQLMGAYRADGLQIVRYSPREEAMPFYAGRDALIRFGKDPSEWTGWDGTDAVVGNITQDMAGRGDACGLSFWQAATANLPTRPAGPRSEELRGGIGALDYDTMRDYLRHLRCFLYTGTRPAPYTLGLIEAMMTGVPVVSIGPAAWGAGWGGDDLFEGADLVGPGRWSDSTTRASETLRRLLLHEGWAHVVSEVMRERAIAEFDIGKVSADWAHFLG